ncbi:glycosyl hydrolase family 95 catalytic domain-containing protein [Paenibacillus sp. Soil787]|uniref:glycosyl hydrolase family 95 catalytic domain-containing protein n=1 Tax=Paenibacillus sp. Soil787 TaxID=1736411 RepID=UPI0007033C83|nr:LamG-like jellyroll fold domain-containing protein [Paenibacillus sp. Soil787]KRF09937.1 hypothetical protein ASG93_19100 [Paenibacillus sp. Soil787]
MVNKFKHFTKKMMKCMLIVTLTTVSLQIYSNPVLAAPIDDANAITSQNAQNIASKYSGVRNTPPTLIPSPSNTDAPLIGNGDVGVAVGGGASNLTFYVGKTDFWSIPKGSIEPVGRIALSIPGMSGASYNTVQDMYNAEVRGTFSTGGNTLKTTSWVNANQDQLITNLANTGSAAQTVTVTPLNGAGAVDSGITSTSNDIVYIDPTPDYSGVTNIGREQYGGGRWYFDGVIDDLRIYNRALSASEMTQLSNMQDVTTGLSYRYAYNAVPSNAYNATLTTGQVNPNALSFNGSNSYVDAGRLNTATYPTTWSIGSWIKINTASATSANYIFSQSAWNSEISLGLSGGKLRVAYKGNYAQSAAAITTGSWVYVSGSYDGATIKAYVNGTLVASTSYAESSPSEPFSKVRMATRVIGASTTVADGKLTFTMQPGSQYQIATSIISSRDDADYQNKALSDVSTLTSTQISSKNASHRGWWQNFWSKSFIEIPNKTIEGSWYGSLYLMAITSRGAVAPGIWGNWINQLDPFWKGDYHLNYNYEMPFYSAYSTNHIELTDNYDQPVLDYMPKGELAAQSIGESGVYYPVGIGPNPINANDGVYHNQKSDAAFAVSNMVQRYYYTRDPAYGDKIYDFLKKVALFWQGYLTWDGANNRYIIENDSPHEGGSYPQTNNVMSLGFVRLILQGCIDISIDKNVDSTLRATWQDILSKLSDYPTMQKNNQTVFRLTETGMDWKDGNSVATLHIFPGNQIGLNSDPNLLQIAYNTVDQKSAVNTWRDGNATSFFYPAAVRVGYSPSTILSKLDYYASGRLSNFSYNFYGGGIENLATVPATLTEMLAQSFQNQIRVFANWPTNTDAKFGNLMAYGGFLVSSKMTNNTVKYVRTISQQGRNATFVNPWPGQTLVVYRNGVNVSNETASGSTFTLSTSVNEVIDIAPVGTTYNQIINGLMLPANVSLNKTVTGYSSQFDSTTWKSANINDGVVNSTSRGWASAYGSGTRDEWVTIDLGQTYNLSSFTIQNEDVSDNRNVKDYILYGSSTGAFGDEKFEISSGTIPSLLHMATHSVSFTPVNARYVKFKGTSSYSNYVIVGELSLFGN